MLIPRTTVGRSSWVSIKVLGFILFERELTHTVSLMSFFFFITAMIIKSQVFYMIQIAMKSLQLTLISPLPGTDYSGHATHINSDHGGQGFL